MPTYLVYPIYTGILGLIAVAVVPRKEIERLAVYGILFGGAADLAAIILFTHLLGIGGYRNWGPFGILGLPFFPPVAWSIYYTIYFYLLPANKPWNYLYATAAAFYSTIFASVLQNLGIFQWDYGRIIVPFLIYISWHAAATWAYQRLHAKGLDAV